MGCPNKRAAKRATVYGMIDSSSFVIENFAKKFAEKSLLHLYKEFIITAAERIANVRFILERRKENFYVW